MVIGLEALGVVVDSLFFPPDNTPTLPHEYQFNLDIAAGRKRWNPYSLSLRSYG
jgi:hypothetical protein